MPKFHFHFVAVGASVADPDGKELANLRDAHRHAVRLIEQVTSNLSDLEDWSGWSVRICSPPHRLLLAVLFPPPIGDRLRIGRSSVG